MTTASDLAQDDTKPDMTPMIDVVFLMIIFFVCIDFKVLEAKLPAFLPKDLGSSPAHVEPQEQLSVRIRVAAPGTPIYRDGAHAGILDAATGRRARFVLENHRVEWEVGPRRLYSVQDALAELSRIAEDPANQVPDADAGSRKLIACVIEADRGTYYADVARTADACREAGFVDIHFGGGLGPR